MTNSFFDTEANPHRLPLIAVVGSGYHLYREYLLASIADHARVLLVLDNPPTWELAYVVDVVIADTLDSDQVVEAVRRHALGAEVAGVICWDEVRMVKAAEVALSLGVPTSDPAGVANCRDKHLTRAALARAGVSQPTSTTTSNLAEARQAADLVGYPVIVKPRALGASIGVVRADDPTELEAAFSTARSAYEDGVPHFDRGVLVENCVVGNEISIDSMIVDGVLTPLFVARKEKGFGEHCEEIGHVVDANDDLMSDPAVVGLLRDAHRAVTYTNGITHTEIMLTPDGPSLIEINARLGGDLIPFVASQATGLDIGDIAVSVAVGEVPNSTPTSHRIATIDFLYPETDGTVVSLSVDESSIPSDATIGLLAQPGAVLELPPVGHVTSRYAYIVTVGDSLATCRATSLEAQAAISFEAASLYAEARS